jgi:type I restriction-modification system specificity subunit
MREMKDSGIAWIGAMPRAWKMNTIAQIFLQVKCKNTGLQEKNLLSLSYGKVKRKSIDTVEGLLPESFDGYNIIEKDDIVLRLTDLQNDHTSLRVGLAEERGIITSAYLTIRNRSNFCPKYLYYYLHSFDIAKGFYGMGAGVRQGLNWDGVKWLKILAPSVPEQERIAAFLDAECAEIDAVLEKTRASIEEYKKLKQAIITQAVTKGIRGDRPMKDSGIEWIGDIPAEWDVIRVKQLLKERNERSKEGKEEPLSMSQKVGLVPTKFLESIPNMASSFVGAKLAYVDDLVFNKLKAHLGVFSVSRYDGLVSPDYAVYCSTGKSNLKYLEYIFKTPQCIGEFRKKSTGIAAGLMRLYTEGLFSIYLPYPALSEQEEIAEYLNEKCAGIDALIAKKQQYLTEIENYKKSLIYEYVTGKKEVHPL